MEGGCACGAIRYRIDAEPYDTGYCHCEVCRRSAGAPVLVFTTVPSNCFVITQGSPRQRQSTSFGMRQFCGDCGTQLTIQVTYQADEIDVTVGSLDRPEVVAPGFHIYTDQQIVWFDTADSLPRHARLRPDTRGLPAGQTNPE